MNLNFINGPQVLGYLVEVLKGIRNNNILLLRCNCSNKTKKRTEFSGCLIKIKITLPKFQSTIILPNLLENEVSVMFSPTYQYQIEKEIQTV